jgi:hypothetical protein
MFLTNTISQKRLRLQEEADLTHGSGSRKAAKAGLLFTEIAE